MADFKNTDIDSDSNITSSFDPNSSTFLRENTRIGVRYIREDIAVGVCKISWFSFGFTFNRELVVELLDISSKGLLIATDKKLKISQEVNIFLKFENNRVFRRKGKVVRQADGPNYRYAIQFDKLSNSLGDYLLETQKKLVFK